MSACACKPEQIVRTETVEVPVPVYVPIPDEHLADCPRVEFPERYTIEAGMDYAAALRESIKKCNEDKAEIRRLQSEKVPD